MNELKMLEQLDRIEKLVRAQKAVLTFDQACDYTGISRSYMYKLTARGEIPFSKPKGKLIFFSRENWITGYLIIVILLKMKLRGEQ